MIQSIAFAMFHCHWILRKLPSVPKLIRRIVLPFIKSKKVRAYANLFTCGAPRPEGTERYFSLSL